MASVLRPASFDDVAAIAALIAEAGIASSRGFYDEEQARAITDQVYGIDSQLIRDRSYHVIEDAGTIVASGGWSGRRTLFGGDQAKGASAAADVPGSDPLLDPAIDAARIRAFFVAPSMARRGLGARLMRHCAAEAWQAGFRRLTLVATMPGVPLYAAFGFGIDGRFELPLVGDIHVPLAHMSRPLPRPTLD